MGVIEVNVLFQVDEIYTVPEVGTVVGGTLYRSACDTSFSFQLELFLKAYGHSLIQ